MTTKRAVAANCCGCSLYLSSDLNEPREIPKHPSDFQIPDTSSVRCSCRSSFSQCDRRAETKTLFAFARNQNVLDLSLLLLKTDKQTHEEEEDTHKQTQNRRSTVKNKITPALSIIKPVVNSCFPHPLIFFFFFPRAAVTGKCGFPTKEKSLPKKIILRREAEMRLYSDNRIA